MPRSRVLPGPRFWGDIVDACELLVDHRVDNPLYDPERHPIAPAVSVGRLWIMWPYIRTNPALPHTFWHSPLSTPERRRLQIPTARRSSQIPSRSKKAGRRPGCCTTPPLADSVSIAATTGTTPDAPTSVAAVKLDTTPQPLKRKTGHHQGAQAARVPCKNAAAFGSQQSLPSTPTPF